MKADDIVKEYIKILTAEYDLDPEKLWELWETRHTLSGCVRKLKWPMGLINEIRKPYFKELEQKLVEEYATHTIYPPQSQILRALEICPYEKVRVVIIGQDPYHTPNMAEGLSFSIHPSIKKFPSSLSNIFKELQSDLGTEPPENGSLIRWAEQGVLLLNRVLTVRKGEAASHHGLGWEHFTKRIIKLLNRRTEPIVFLLWGKHAQKMKELITKPQHHILETSHPSGLSAHCGFIGSKPFSKTNALLNEPVIW